MKRLAPWLVVIALIAAAVWWMNFREAAPTLAPPTAPATEAASAADATPQPVDAAAVTAERAVDPAAPVLDGNVVRHVLRGRVEFADGRPAVGAEVRAFASRPPLGASQRGGRGRPGNPRGDATPEKGQAVHDLSGSDGGGRDDDEDDGPDEDPATARRDASIDAPLVKAAADADGRFELRDLLAPRLFVDAIAPLAACVEPLEITFAGADGEAKERDGLVVVLADGAALRGRVVDESGAPVAGARVTAGTHFDPFSVFSGEGFDVRRPWRVLTDADGAFALAGVSAGLELNVSAAAEGFAPSATKRARTAVGQVATLELTLERGARIDVVVRDPDGAPLAGMRCRLEPAALKLGEISSDGGESIRGWSRRLDGDGRTSWDGLAIGRYKIRVDRKPWVETEREVAVDVAGQGVAVEVTVARGQELRGRVVAKDGTPIAGARLSAGEAPSITNVMRMALGTGKRRAVADADGRFVLEGLPPSEVQVEATAKGYESATAKGTAGAGDVEIVMATCGALEGIVLSRVTNKPLTEFTLRIERRDNGSGDLFDVASMVKKREVTLRFAHEQGKFRVVGLAPGEMRLSLEAPGHGRFVGDWFTLENGATRKGIIATLGPESVIEGVVVAAADGKPIAGAEIRSGADTQNAMQKAMAQFLPGAETIVSDEAGRFRIGGLGAGNHRFTVKKEGYVETTPPAVALGAGETSALQRIELAKGGEIWGEVRGSDGAPVTGASVMCQDLARFTFKSVKSDAGGVYRIEGLPGGNFALTRMPAEMAMGGDNFIAEMQSQIETRSLKLREGESLRVDFGGKPTGRAKLTGRVVSAGAPLPEAMVQLIAGGEEGRSGGIGIATSDAQGRFEFDSLQAGRAFVQVNLGDFSAGGMNAAFKPVLLRDGETTDVTVEVPAASVSGTLVARDGGEPLAGITVYVAAAEGASTNATEMALRRSLATRSDAKGQFQLQHVRAGRCRIVAGSGDLIGGGNRDFAITSFPIDVPATGRVEAGALALPRSARISGTLTDKSGKPLAQGSLFLRDPETGAYLEEWTAASSGDGGDFDYTGVPSGTWDVVARAPGHAMAVRRGVVARVGEVAHVKLELMGGTEVFALIGDVPFDDLLTLSVTIEGPDGPIPLTLFGMSEIAEVMNAPWQPDVVRLGRFAPGTYRILGTMRGKPFEKSVTLAGEPELRLPISFD